MTIDSFGHETLTLPPTTLLGGRVTRVTDELEHSCEVERMCVYDKAFSLRTAYALTQPFYWKGKFLKIFPETNKNEL